MLNTTRRGFLGWLGAALVLRKATVPVANPPLLPTAPYQPTWTRITELSDQVYAMTPSKLPLTRGEARDMEYIMAEYTKWRRARALKELGYDA